jgi:hypothetical protein
MIGNRGKYILLLSFLILTGCSPGTVRFVQMADPQMTTAALSTNFGRDSSGFRVVTISKKQWSQRYFSLDSLSNQLNVRE